MTASSLPDTATRLRALRQAAQALAAPPAKAHFIGLGGVGMAGLALLLKQQYRWQVSGCDLARGKLLELLRGQGIDSATGHDPAHVAELDSATDLVAYSTAVPPDTPELIAARASGIPTFERGVLFAALCDAQPRGIAVCGSHGKTTTSTFIAQLLTRLDQPVGWCIGGSSATLGAPARAASAPEALFVAECDESDGTLALHHPSTLVVTNVDFDHMEHFESVAAFESVFTSAIRQTRGHIVYCLDDPRAAALCADAPRSLAVGLHPQARLRAADPQLTATHTDFELLLDGQSLGRQRLGQPGLHNLLNALLALGAAHVNGIDLAETAACLAEGLSLPARRFEELPTGDGVRVIMDYAHHPAEIAALVAMTRIQPHCRILAIFQPHRYTRTLALGPRFPAAFEGVAVLALAPVFAASEAPVAGGSSGDLARLFAAENARSTSLPDVFLEDSLAAAWERIRDLAQAGDILLLIGAGDIATLAPRAVELAHIAPERSVAVAKSEEP